MADRGSTRSRLDFDILLRAVSLRLPNNRGKWQRGPISLADLRCECEGLHNNDRVSRAVCRGRRGFSSWPSAALLKATNNMPQTPPQKNARRKSAGSHTFIAECSHSGTGGLPGSGWSPPRGHLLGPLGTLNSESIVHGTHSLFLKVVFHRSFCGSVLTVVHFPWESSTIRAVEPSHRVLIDIVGDRLATPSLIWTVLG